jgi:ribulose-phosphate 3-epimerase
MSIVTQDGSSGAAPRTPNRAIVASVLNADLTRLGEVCSGLETAGLDAIQWDVMDARFVPNLTVGPGTIAACRKATSLPFEAHLMIVEPERWIEQYAEAGCEYVIVHEEASVHLHRTLSQIRDLGVGAGVALNPHTPLEAITNVIDLIDLLLVMTVNPGFGGQSYIRTMERKLAAARELIDRQGRPIELEVDGGISPDTIEHAASAGANRFVVGSALYRDPGPPGVCAELRSLLAAEEGVPA